MYIGAGTLVVILLIVLIVYFLRRGLTPSCARRVRLEHPGEGKL